jgi:hypothetical protein
MCDSFVNRTHWCLNALLSFSNPDYIASVFGIRSNNKKYFSLNTHIAVIRDINDILSKYYECKSPITTWMLNGLSGTVGLKRSRTVFIDANSFSGLQFSDLVNFSGHYDKVLKSYGGFVVTFSPVLALMYEKYDKPVFVHNATRYEVPLSWTKNYDFWRKANESLKRMYDSGQLKVVSNNRVDQRYFYDITGIPSEYIPSLCAYNNNHWAGEDGPILSYGKEQNSEKLPFQSFRSYFGTVYDQKSMNKVSGMVQIPYEVSTMSLFEQYRSGIPMILPSSDLLRQLVLSGDVDFYGNYMNLEHDEEIPEFLRPYRHYYNKSGFLSHFIDLADYYMDDVMPHLSYFNTIDEVTSLVESLDLHSINHSMVQFSLREERRIIQQFGDSFSKHMGS